MFRWAVVALLIFFVPSVGFADVNLREIYDLSLTLKQRIYLQNDLIMTGSFDGVVDGKIGPATLKGIKRFQKKNGFRPNGLMTDEQVQLLKFQRRDISAIFGLTQFEDKRSGFSYMVPESLVFELKPRENGTQFFGKDGGYIQSVFVTKSGTGTLKALYEAKKRKIGKALVKSEWHKSYFILYESNSEHATYYTVHSDGKSYKGMFISIDHRLDHHAASVAKYIIRSFMPYFQPPIRLVPEKPKSVIKKEPDQPFSGI